MAGEAGGSTGRTEWAERAAPLRAFLHTESSSAVVLLAATLAALVWVNVDSISYDHFWDTQVAIRIGDSGITMMVRDWVNSGLMTFFFFVIGLEARREGDLGELRERSRAVLPVVAGVAGMAVAPLIYLAINAGHSSAHGWGIAMSTDTAFALGVLAFVGSRAPSRLRSFILTVVVIDDVVALIVIATVYAGDVRAMPIVVAAAILVVLAFLVRLRVTVGLVYFGMAAAAWVALQRSGVDPIVVGLLCGLLTWAAPARAVTSSARPISSGVSASSRRPSSPARPGPASSRRCHPTNASSSCTTRGRATSSCRCSP